VKKICIVYHCLLYGGNPPDLLPNAYCVVNEQMQQLKDSGLLYKASEFIVGINGEQESNEIANLLIPKSAKRILHGLNCYGENRTILEIEEFSKTHRDWNILYFHSKGATHPNDMLRINWRRCMMRQLVTNWGRCVQDLDSGFESVGCHWLTNMGSDRSQNYWGGNFWWANSDFIRTLPSICSRTRIRISGIDSLDSRYEAEAWIGIGSRLPKVKDYHPENPSIIGKCM